MKVGKVILYTFLFQIYCLQLQAQSIIVNDTKNASELVNLLTTNNSCLQIANESVSGDTFNPEKNSYGIFTNSSPNFPFQSGIVLSTWSSTLSSGPFVRNVGGGNNSWIGDSDLNQSLGINSINATVLEFDFTPFTNSISFNYLLASNEYQDEYPCKYSDGFAFLIKEKGSTDPYKNLALIPETSTPVSSKNIHPAINFTDNFNIVTKCDAVNETFFGRYNNTINNNSPINYAGQTKVLNAHTTVIPGTTYHIKLVIADDQNPNYDSAIFIEAASFNSSIDLGLDKLLTTNNAICYGNDYLLDTKLPATYIYKWYKDGNLLPTEINPSLTVKTSGTYKVEVFLNPSSCPATGEIKIEYTPVVVLNNTSLTECDIDGDGKATYDLTQADNQIKNNNTTLSNVEYYTNLTDAQSSNNPILNVTNYSNTSLNQLLIAKVINTYNCAYYAELTLKISNESIPSQAPTIECDDDEIKDGFRQFNLDTEVSPQLLNSLPNGLSVAYFLNQNDAIAQTNAIPNLFTNTIQNQQIIYARVINGSNCYGITPISLIVKVFSPPNFEDETLGLCDNSNLTLTVDTNYSSYLWNTGEQTNSIEINSEGNYWVKVTNSDNCEAIKNYHIVTSEPATITAVETNDFNGKNNNATILYTGSGDYEFSIDGDFFQNSPEFTNLAVGNYVAYARDKNSCGLSNSFPFTILDYPRFFTPNGDGFNDTWTIKNLNSLPPAIITIYDRYGKLIKEFNSSNFNWNGTLNGYQLPADDYWFQLTFKNNKKIRGHFSLKR